MPYTSKPGTRASGDARAAQIAGAAGAEGSADSDAHLRSEIKKNCPGCGALINERCIAERYPSGKPKQYKSFCPERTALVPEENRMTSAASRKNAAMKRDEAVRLAAENKENEVTDTAENTEPENTEPTVQTDEQPADQPESESVVNDEQPENTGPEGEQPDEPDAGQRDEPDAEIVTGEQSAEDIAAAAEAAAQTDDDEKAAAAPAETAPKPEALAVDLTKGKRSVERLFYFSTKALEVGVPATTLIAMYAEYKDQLNANPNSTTKRVCLALSKLIEAKQNGNVTPAAPSEDEKPAEQSAAA